MKQNSISKMAKKSFAFLARNSRAVMTCCLMLCVSLVFADDATTTPAAGTGGDMSAADTAFTQVTTQLTGYIPLVRSLCYALAGVVAIVGAISVYIKMNNEEQDVKKSIMMIVGACIFLIAAAEALPMFFSATGN